MFVKLTGTGNAGAVYIRADAVVSLEPNEAQAPLFTNVHSADGAYFQVLETPEQIIQLIEHTLIANGTLQQKWEKQVITFTEHYSADAVNDTLAKQMAQLQLMMGGQISRTTDPATQGLSTLMAPETEGLLEADAESRITATLDSAYVAGDTVQLHSHEVNLCNASIVITRRRPDAYAITSRSLDGLSHDWVLTTIKFHTGDPKNGINGVTIESLLAVAMDRLLGFQAGAMNCVENAAAINSIKEALRILGRRAYRRELQGTQGHVTPDKP